MSAPALHRPALWDTGAARSRRVEWAAFAVALLAHAAICAVRFEAPQASARPALAFIDVSTEEAPRPAEPPPAPLPVSEPSEARSPVTERSAAPAFHPGPAASSNSNSTTEEAAPLVAGDETFDADWQLPSGNGSALRRGSSGRGGGGLSGPGRALGLAPRDFSREAIAPALQPWVDKNFPSTARMYKVDGDVVVSALIGSDGAPSDLRVENAEPGGRGFGEACSRSVLQGPRWKPKLSRDGTPLPSRVTYRCAFRLSAAERGPSGPSEGGRKWTYSTGD